MTKLDTSRVVTLPLEPIAGVELPTILALDTGGTTGYAYRVAGATEVICGQLGPQMHHRRLYELIVMLLELPASNGHLTIVYEQFEFRQNEEALRMALRNYVSVLRKGEIKSLGKIIESLSRICETWQGRDNLVLTSRNYIGVIEFAAQTHKGITLTSHSASEAKTFIKDIKLKALGWYALTAALPHARDALRHLLRHLVVTCKVRDPITTAWFNRAS